MRILFLPMAFHHENPKLYQRTSPVNVVTDRRSTQRRGKDSTKLAAKIA